MSQDFQPMPTAVADTFASYESDIAKELCKLRELILVTAAETDGVGVIEEGLRWNQPSFLTTRSRSGSTIRVAPTSAKSDHDFAMFFICNTTLVEGFRDQFGDTFTYDGNRALLFNVGDELPVEELRQCVTQALTYKL